MANVTDLRIDIASEFTGAKAFKKAQDSTFNLEKTVRNLGKTLGVTLGTAAFVRFGKESVKAFIADEKAAAVLANTVKNLGMAMSAPSIDAFVQSLERATGVVDDQLRPAMQTLLQVTGSVTKSQKILAQAIEVSRATGIDLTTVAQDLGQAYVGNTRGLRKYSLGLTQAELKTADFADIQERLTQLFGGANEAYLSTYAGQMERLGVAASEAKEAIGRGLVDALANLNGGGEGGLDKTISLIDTLSNGVAKLITNMGVGFGQGLMLLRGDFAGFKRLGEEALKGKAYTGAIPSIQAMVQQSQQAKAEKAALTRAKELAKATASTTKDKQKQLMLEKAKLALTKAAANFDITKINLLAALKGKVSEEDRKRLLALQAIENDNGELALKYISELDYARKLAADAEEARLKALADAEMKRQEALLASIKARMDAIQAMMDKVQRKIDANAAEALAQTSSQSVESRIQAIQQMTDKVQRKIDGNAAAAAATSGMSFSSASAGSYYADKLFSSPESLGLSDRANTERNAAMNINISLDGQAFQSAVVGAVNQASSSGTPLSYNLSAIR